MTRAQLKPFFRAVSRAASAQGLVGREAVEAYRREVMREEAGADHAADIDPGAGYDRVMYRLAVDGDEYYWWDCPNPPPIDANRIGHWIDDRADLALMTMRA